VLLARRAALEAERTSVRARLARLDELRRVQAFAELHWQPLAARVAAIEAEQAALEAGADALRLLEAQLREVEGAREAARTEAREAADALGKLKQKIEDREAEHARALERANEADAGTRAARWPRLATWCAEALPERTLTVEGAQAMQSELRGWLQARLNALDKVLKRLEERIIGAMKDFKHAYPRESSEWDAHVGAGAEYRAFLVRLLDEDLPRHEQAFKAMLNERTIQGVAMFHTWLEKGYRAIEDKIATINRSLRAIPYNAGTYIQLEGDRAKDPELLEFRAELRACVSDALSGDDAELYAEHRFVRVKRLIDRFRGRPDLVDADARWRRKVVDVRNWMAFGAIERWAQDDAPREYYQDAAGKSGGQKEKLAYTILASALAYQYGLDRAEGRGDARTFRFVMIDEAFGRGSDESARYGLELFGRLGLQLLVVTPLQKIHVIEDYVRSVHLVHNHEGRRSEVRTLTIDDYRAGKAGSAAP
jgi:uncharacterized protein YPO0396